jgi:hypothetical protein
VCLPPFILVQRVDFAREAGPERERPECRQHLTTTDLVRLDAAEQQTNVLPGDRPFEGAVELFHARDDHLQRITQAEQLDLGSGDDHALLDLARGDPPPPLDGVDTLDRHEKRPIDHPLRVGNVVAQSIQQLLDAPAGRAVAGCLERPFGVPAEDRCMRSIESVFRQQITGFYLHKIDQLGIVHEIDLLDEVHEVGVAQGIE